MRVQAHVHTLLDLFRVANASVGALAKSMGVTGSTVSCKVHGRRSWYADEIDALVDALNAPAALVKPVDRDTVVRLLGADRVLVRGTLADSNGGDK